MIFSLRGTVIHKTEHSVIVEAGGVGYEVFVPMQVLSVINESDDEYTFYTYHVVREDSQLLFGFTNLSDRTFFIQLTSVSGIGPKVGIKVLSTLSVQDVMSAILQDNVKVLTTVPGVGKKVAERMIVELKDKLPQGLISSDSVSVNAVQPTPQTNDDVFQGLKALGYSSDEIKRAYHRAALQVNPEGTLEETIRVLLKYL